MAKKVVYVAEMDTGKFKFVALGKSAAEAEAALAKRWTKHAREYGLEPWNRPGTEDNETMGDYFGMWLRPMEVGVGYMEDEAYE